MQDVVAFCMIAAIGILFVAPFLNYSGKLDCHNRLLNFSSPKFPSIFFAFPLKDQMVNYTRLAWKLACMLRTYGTYNPMVGFSKYEFNNKLLVGVTFFRVTLGVTWTQLYIS